MIDREASRAKAAQLAALSGLAPPPAPLPPDPEVVAAEVAHVHQQIRAGRLDEQQAAEYLLMARAGRRVPRRFEGTADAGARTTPPTPSPAEQIRAAEASGDWRTANRLKAAQIVQTDYPTTPGVLS